MPDAEDFLDLSYHLVVMRAESDDDAPGWVARVEELVGCIAQGRTPAELMANVRRAMLAWIDATLEDGDAVPLPRSDDGPGWGFMVRIPFALQAKLEDAARNEGIALDAWVARELQRAVAPRDSTRSAAKRKAG